MARFSQDNPEDRKKYWQIYQGKFACRAREGTQGAINRVNKLGKSVWELHFDNVEGVITAVSREDSQFGRQLIVELDNHDIIKVPWSSAHTKRLLNTLPNIDLQSPVTLRPFRYTPEDRPDKVYTGWIIQQNKARVEEVFAKERIPPMKEVLVNGTKVWDSTEQLDFLWVHAMTAWNKYQESGGIPPDLEKNLEAIDEDCPY